MTRVEARAFDVIHPFSSFRRVAPGEFLYLLSDR